LLTASATALGKDERPGSSAGLVNAYRAVTSLNGKPIDKNDGDDQAKR
jgi:hypothetical protein